MLTSVFDTTPVRASDVGCLVHASSCQCVDSELVVPLLVVLVRVALAAVTRLHGRFPSRGSANNLLEGHVQRIVAVQYLRKLWVTFMLCIRSLASDY